MLDLTEEMIVERISRLIKRPGPGEHLYYPEDARDLLPRGPRIIYSMDAYTLRSLKLPWRSYRDVGWSALVGAISDTIVKGGIPHASMIALGLPRETSLQDLDDLLTGLEEAANAYMVKIAGGDTNESSEAWIAVSVLGFTSARVPPSRRGLRRGDAIIVTGVYGAMGYVVKHGIERARELSWVVESTKRPRVRLEIGIVISELYKGISASMDVSDGLGYTLSCLSTLGNTGVLLKQPPIVHDEIVEICRSDVRCILDYALSGGEEYGAVIGVKKEWVNHLVKELEYFNIPYVIVGEAVDSPPGVYFAGEKLEITRYDQFHGWGYPA